MIKWGLLTAAVLLTAGLLIFARNPRARGAPCRTLVQACQKAGITRGTTRETRRLFRDNCLVPILQTGAFAGEQFDPEIVSRCKSLFERKRTRFRGT